MKCFDEVINQIKKVVSFKSINSEALPNAPFGRQVKECLDYSLSLAESFGFQTKNYDGYAGEIIFGEGNDQDGLAILCHLDVVPAGDESAWIYPPFECTYADEKIYGRGVVDNKGPFVLCLFILKELKESGFIPSKKIKLILGCNEESGFKCMEHYLKVATMPNVGFTPDSNFPLIYAEKGILRAELTFNMPNGIKELYGGETINVVPDYAYCVLDDFTEEVINKATEYGATINGSKIEFFGKVGHASTPYMAENAVKKMVAFLSSVNLFDQKDYDNVFENGTGLYSLKDDIASISVSPDIIRIEDEKIVISVDIRFPVTFSKEYMQNQLKKVAPFHVLDYSTPLYVPKDSFLVSTLMNIYNKYNNSNDEPICIGGGTYAKVLKQGVAFGPLVPENYRAHIPNEYFTKDELEFCYNVYKEAIIALSK